MEMFDNKQLMNGLTEMTLEELEELNKQLDKKEFNKAALTKLTSAKCTFRRENKNRPTEISSKKRVSRIRNVIEVKKKVCRDPRFDDLSGSYNETYFTQAYGFLSDVKEREKQQLLKHTKHEKDPDKRTKMNDLLLRMAQKEKKERQEEHSKMKDKERKVIERKAISEGKKPFYLKKSEKKKLDMEEKLAKLEKSGGLDKFKLKQEKKALQKDRKNLPFLE